MSAALDSAALQAILESLPEDTPNPENVQVTLDRGVVLRKKRPNGNGGWLVDAFVTRPGVYEYAYGRELVTAEFLRRPDVLSSMKMKPVTLEHPPAGYVLKHSYRALAHGMSGEQVSVAENGFVRMTLNITTPEGVAVVDALPGMGETMHEVSVGSITTHRKETGVHPEHGEYDCVRTMMVANHIALTKNGRAGPAVRIRNDSKTPPPGGKETPSGGPPGNKETPSGGPPGGANSNLGSREDPGNGNRGPMDLEAQVKELKQKLEDAIKAIAAKDAELASLREEHQVTLDSRDARITELEAGGNEDERKAKAEAAQADRQWRRSLDSLVAKAKIEKADDMDTDALNAAVVKALELPVLTLDSVEASVANRHAIAYHLKHAPKDAYAGLNRRGPANAPSASDPFGDIDLTGKTKDA